jgi:hypothetical protein
MMQHPTLIPASDTGRGLAILQRQGHLGLNGAFTSQDIAELTRELQRVVALHQRVPLTWMEASVADYGEGWVFQEQLWRRSPRLADWLLEGPPAQLVCRMLQRLDVWLLRDQTYFKRAGSEATGWHQDGTFIPVDALRSLTMWIPLSLIGPEASPMHYHDASHTTCQLQPFSESGLDFDGLLEHWLAASESVSVYDCLEPGDCLIHDTWCLHGSPQHRQRQARLAFVVVYGYGEGCLATTHSLNSCGPLLRDEALLLRRAIADACFPDMEEGAWIPGLDTPMVRVSGRILT